MKGKAVKKENLPQKVCPVCGHPFNWRKKWEKVWEDVSIVVRDAEGKSQDEYGLKISLLIFKQTFRLGL